jgi:LmbE family N-acetylglucosaminyl deacetylase|tara:strand:+ start:105 stop:323 length:219 start_codon:yes stop_codon:yes gene_type:complete
VNIIVISPHPDDETLGCGGTILKHKENGDNVHWLIMTNTLIEEGYDELMVKTRQMDDYKGAKMNWRKSKDAR